MPLPNSNLRYVQKGELVQGTPIAGEPIGAVNRELAKLLANDKYLEVNGGYKFTDVAPSNDSNIDSAPLLQSLFDSLTKPTSIILPPGEFHIKSPLTIPKYVDLIPMGGILVGSIYEEGSLNLSCSIRDCEYQWLDFSIDYLDGNPFGADGRPIWLNYQCDGRGAYGDLDAAETLNKLTKIWGSIDITGVYGIKSKWDLNGVRIRAKRDNRFWNTNKSYISCLTANAQIFDGMDPYASVNNAHLQKKGAQIEKLSVLATGSAQIDRTMPIVRMFKTTLTEINFLEITANNVSSGLVTNFSCLAMESVFDSHVQSLHVIGGGCTYKSDTFGNEKNAAVSIQPATISLTSGGTDTLGSNEITFDKLKIESTTGSSLYIGGTQVNGIKINDCKIEARGVDVSNIDGKGYVSLPQIIMNGGSNYYIGSLSYILGNTKSRESFIRIENVWGHVQIDSIGLAAPSGDIIDYTEPLITNTSEIEEGEVYRILEADGYDFTAIGSSDSEKYRIFTASNVSSAPAFNTDTVIEKWCKENRYYMKAPIRIKGRPQSVVIGIRDHNGGIMSESGFYSVIQPIPKNGKMDVYGIMPIWYHMQPNSPTPRLLPSKDVISKRFEERHNLPLAVKSKYKDSSPEFFALGGGRFVGFGSVKDNSDKIIGARIVESRHSDDEGVLVGEDGAWVDDNIILEWKYDGNNDGVTISRNGVGNTIGGTTTNCIGSGNRINFSNGVMSLGSWEHPSFIGKSIGSNTGYFKWMDDDDNIRYKYTDNIDDPSTLPSTHDDGIILMQPNI